MSRDVSLGKRRIKPLGVTISMLATVRDAIPVLTLECNGAVPLECNGTVPTSTTSRGRKCVGGDNDDSEEWHNEALADWEQCDNGFVC